MSFKYSKVIKHCSFKMAKSFGDDKIVKYIEIISFSHQTVSRKTLEISEQTYSQLKKEIEKLYIF